MNASSIYLLNVAHVLINLEGVLLYANIPNFVMNVVFNMSSSSTITWLYPKYPSRKGINLDPFTIYNTSTSKGKG